MALCAKTSSTDQVLEAMRFYFGERHCRSILFVADVSGSLDGEYFDLNVIDEDYAEKKYAVLLSDGTTTVISGLPTGTTQITVTYTENDAAATIAGLLVTALAAVEVRTELTGDTLEIQNQFVGVITAEINTNAFSETFTVEALGFGGYLGQVGEAELTTETSFVELLDDAQGSIKQGEIITGQSVELTVPLREMTTARWESLIGSVAGSTVTIDGSDITGWGTAKLYNSMFTFSGRLVGHPVRLANSDRSADICMLLTAPKMSSINFSGGTVQEAEFVFSAYKDGNAPATINLCARGDHSKF